jgi:hypothetical protein
LKNPDRIASMLYRPPDAGAGGVKQSERAYAIAALDERAQ